MIPLGDRKSHVSSKGARVRRWACRGLSTFGRGPEEAPGQLRDPPAGQGGTRQGQKHPLWVGWGGKAWGRGPEEEAGLSRVWRQSAGLTRSPGPHPG